MIDLSNRFVSSRPSRRGGGRLLTVEEHGVNERQENSAELEREELSGDEKNL